MENRRNYYRILHVQPDAPTEIIRMSYLTLMQRLSMHPDLGGDHATATLINEAFAVLMDPERRAGYDRELALGHALPGYRSSDARTRRPHQAHRSTGSGCSFCGAPHAASDASRPDACCGACGSPLCRASEQDRSAPVRRAVARLPRTMALTFRLSWPQAPYTGVTHDLSTHGMRFRTSVDLVPNERIQLECPFCAAVAVVRHCKPTGDELAPWDVGVEFLTLRFTGSRGTLLSKEA